MAPSLGLLFAWLASAPPELPPDPLAGDPADTSALEDPPAPGPSSATHGLVSARVYALGSREALAGIKVIPIEAPELEARTNEEGEVELWLEPGTHRLRLVADGYAPKEIEVEVQRGQRSRFVFRLARGARDRYRTIVESERGVAVSSTRLRDRELREVPGTGGDPFGVVRTLPGASQVAGFLPYVVVRGAAPGNTGYYLDGVRVPILFHVAVGPSVIHPYFIDEVDFYAGGAPVRLGRFTSGIVEGRTKTPSRDRVRGDFDLRLTDAGGIVDVPFDRRNRDPNCRARRRAQRRSGEEGPSESEAALECEKGDARGAMAIAGRYSYTGLILSAIPALNVKLRYWDFQARLDHDLGRRARYRLFAFGSFDEVGQRQTELIDDETGEITVDRNPDPFLRFEFYRLTQRISHPIREGSAQYDLTLGLDRAGLGDIRTDEWRVAPRATWLKKVSPRAQVGVGLDAEVQVFRVPDDIIGNDAAEVQDLALLLANRVVTVVGAWTDLRWKSGRVEVRPGIRGDVYVQVGASPYLPRASSVTQAFGVDPRLLVREKIADRWTLRQSVGVYHQPPDAPIPIPGIESFGFERGLQRNIQGTFGYELDLDVAILTQDVYLGRLSNLQDYELAQATDEGPDELEDFLINVEGWTYGLESMLRLAPGGRAYGWVAYTLARSTRVFPVGGASPSNWDQTHIVNVVLGYQLGNKWRFGGRLHFHTGRPYTSIAVDGMGEPTETDEEALARHRNDARLPAFLQFDARIERIWSFRVWQLSAFLDVANATFAREIFGCDTTGNPENATVVAGCQNPQGLRYVLPALGVRGRF